MSAPAPAHADQVISVNIEIFWRDGNRDERGNWVNAAGKLFGPFRTQNAAINAVPDIIRSLD